MSAVTSSIASKATSWWDTSEMNMPPGLAEHHAQMRASIREICTPLNLSIFFVLLTIVILRARTINDIELDPSRPITFRTFTPRSLLRYNGTTSPMNKDGAVYLAVRGKVYDVSGGRNFYGPGGPYENFAGRDATRGLACQSFDEEMLTKDLDGPLDTCEDLDADQLENLKGWIERFDEKYLIVGNLVAYNKTASAF